MTIGATRIGPQTECLNFIARILHYVPWDRIKKIEDILPALAKSEVLASHPRCNREEIGHYRRHLEYGQASTPSERLLFTLTNRPQPIVDMVFETVLAAVGLTRLPGICTRRTALLWLSIPEKKYEPAAA